MKKTIVKQTIAALAATVMCLGTTGVPAFAAKPDTNVIAPQNVVITKTDNRLTLSSGVTTCYGKTSVPTGYTAGVIVELQQMDGSWQTIKTWNAKESVSALIQETYSVSKGYSYQLKVTHTAYNSSGILVEVITKYSDIITY